MSHPIASPQNPRLKEMRRLRRKRERERTGRFLVEGEDLIAAAQRAGREALVGARVTGSELGGSSFVDVEPAILADVSTLESGTRVIGVYEQRWSETPIGPLCVYLHGVGDPGNVGTVLRGAEAFGASCVAFGPGCADPYSPKAVRASMGAIFAVPVARVRAVVELPGERVALLAHGGEPLSGPSPSAAVEQRTCAAAPPGASKLPSGPYVDASHPVTLLVGAEREGLPAEVVRACERVAHIPIFSDSLNAAMAATVALYEMTRVPAS
jgi:RNA methyltransferase, TrmH family